MMSGRYNPQQSLAINSLHGPVLVSAGPGTGKTTILAARIKKIISEGYAMPDQILAVTFTNRAANELKSRIGDCGVWIGTFHSICYKVLCQESQAKFNIIDKLAQRKTLEIVLESKRYLADEAIEEIEKYQNLGVPFKKHQQTFKKYEAFKKEKQILDYADLLKMANEFLSDSEKAKKYQFKFVLVDEYQDTNAVQQKWLLRLLTKEQNIFCVGDENQSIFEWRGSDPSLMKNFQSIFIGAKIIDVSVNYRSTRNILDTANSLIRKNTTNKHLTGVGGIGEKVSVFECPNDQVEAMFVMTKLKELGGSCAVLARTANALSKFREIKKLDHGQEFSDYAKYLSDPENLELLLKIANTPKRGIGPKTLEKVKENGIGYAKTLKALRGVFGGVIAASKKQDFSEKLEAFLVYAGYKSVKFPKISNFKEFCEKYSKQNIELLTIHSAKGLEFDNVALIGWEEGLFPHGGGMIQEERRLAYVGITRTRKNLIITYSRYRNNARYKAIPSRFLDEIPMSVNWGRGVL